MPSRWGRGWWWVELKPNRVGVHCAWMHSDIFRFKDMPTLQPVQARNNASKRRVGRGGEAVAVEQVCKRSCCGICGTHSLSYTDGAVLKGRRQGAHRCASLRSAIWSPGFLCVRPNREPGSVKQPNSTLACRLAPGLGLGWVRAAAAAQQLGFGYNL